MATLPPLDVSAEDRQVLQGWLRAHKTEQRMWLRARVVLMAADGATNRSIAAETGLSEEAVSRWRRRYAEAGVKGLKDRDRSGRPPVYGHDERLRVEISDDGVGGADAGSGTGLRGLADRVGALDGTLQLTSRAQRGTTICAELPCVS